MVKPAAETTNSQRVENARLRKPDSGIMMTSAIRQAVCTHEISSADAESPAWISASDAETIWMSRIAMNIPNTIARKAKTRRGSILSLGTAGLAGAPGAEAMAVAEADIVSYSAARKKLRTFGRSPPE